MAALVEFEGTQTGVFYGIEPRGARVHMSMLNMLTIRNGKIVEKRAHYDRWDHMEQLRRGSSDE